MAIEVICPSCDTSHKVKDESADKGTLQLLIAITVLQLILWATDLVMLLTRSAKEYCNEP